MLAQHEVYRRIKPVDISGVLGLLEEMQFVHVNQTTPKRYPCQVVVRAAFPQGLRDFIDGLGLGGTPGRQLLRKLMPRQSIPIHVDDWMPQELYWRRFQVPLVSHPDIKMRWPEDGAEAFLEPGYLYEVRFDRMHEVVHNADCERVHLQIDQVDATI